MSLASAKEALTTAVLSTLSPIPVARENVVFEKPAGVKWAEFFWLPNQPQPRTMGDTGYDMWTGIAQVDLHYPANTGDAAADTDTEEFRAAFKAGHGFTHSGQSIIVSDCGAPHRRKEDNWFIVSVTIGWYALVPR
jgi:hypothetical protein